MMSIQVGLKKKEKINCILGYSGKVINQTHLSKKIISKPKILLMHGVNDTIQWLVLVYFLITAPLKLHLNYN